MQSCRNNMEYIINELSLDGQYRDVNDFAENALQPLVSILKKLREYGIAVVLKKSDFFTAKVCPNIQLFEINQRYSSKLSDQYRSLRSQLAAAQTEPYWDECPTQDMGTTYLMLDGENVVDVSRSSVSEAKERGDILLSFPSEYYDTDILHVYRKDEEKPTSVNNVTSLNQLHDLLFRLGALNKETYFPQKFAQKFDFSELRERFGFNLINERNISVFLSAFRDFERMTWQQIRTSDGFDYKKFNKNRNTKDFFTDSEWEKEIFKFRVDQEIRCFGYEQNNVFHLLRIDLDHVLSDLG